MKSKFNEYEKKINELTNEIIDGNKALNFKDREIEELNRRIIQAEDDFSQKSRANKNTVDEQLHSIKIQHTSDIKNQMDDNRRMKDTIAKLEDRLKSALQAEQNKDRSLLDSERKYSELSDKINTISNQMKIERDNNDRLCMENEELKRKLTKEEIRSKKALEEIKEFENEFKSQKENHQEDRKIGRASCRERV